jgi:hypothetical protein
MAEQLYLSTCPRLFFTNQAGVDAKAGPCSELRWSVVTRNPFERMVVDGIFTEESRLKRACHRSRRVFVIDVNQGH